MRKSLFILLFLFCLPLFADTLGPTSELYAVKWQNSGIAVIQGNSVVRSWATSANSEIAIAVTDKVRTLGHYLGNTGAEYALNGTFTGTNYTASDYYHHDGATDGLYNYAILYSSGNVYRYSLNWTNPEYLFNAGSYALGITYDPTNSSLWIGSWSYGNIKNFNLTGGVLSEFSVSSRTNYVGGLAMDYADGTLWFSEGASGTFSQYTRTGTYLGSKTYSISGIYGAEFSVVSPEPSTIALMGILLGILLFQKRKI